MSASEERFADAVGALGPPLLRTLDVLEKAARYLHPPVIHGLRRSLAPLQEPLETALAAFEQTPAPDASGALAEPLAESARRARDALALFLTPAPGPQATLRILESLRLHSRAQAALYPLHAVLLPVSRYFLEPALWERAALLDPDPPRLAQVGLLHAENAEAQRGGFTLYVPEWLEPGARRPLVVALHGGSGHGASFLWTWLREARSRGFLLLAATSQGPTWSLHGADRDAGPLDAAIEAACARFPVDPARILLTGLSDGATYSLLYGLRASSPCSALAPVSGVLHPANFSNGNLGRARGRRIHLVHGSLDWLFPVGLARAAAEELRRGGAELEYLEIEDLSHTYPREANDAILRWFDASLALPVPGRTDQEAKPGGRG
jgi:phospholipase/carboxylesterase